MGAILVYQGLVKVLDIRNKLLNTLSDDQNGNRLEKAHSAILLNFGDEMLWEAASETL